MLGSHNRDHNSIVTLTEDFDSEQDDEHVAASVGAANSLVEPSMTSDSVTVNSIFTLLTRKLKNDKDSSSVNTDQMFQAEIERISKEYGTMKLPYIELVAPNKTKSL